MPSTTRREFLTGLLAAAAATALPVHAADAPAAKLTEDDPQAKALNYVENSKKAEKDPAFKAGSTCSKCTLYQTAQEKGGRAPCAAFAGKTVNKDGWCRAFAAKT